MKNSIFNAVCKTRYLALLVVLIFTCGNVWGADVTYELTISGADFNTTSYAANNNEKTTKAVCTTDATKEMDVDWTSYQVMKSGNNMQWQKSKGYIYNSTDLGTINSVTVTSSAGSFTTYYGTSEQPSSGSSGSGKGYFKTSVGSATGTMSTIVINFTISEGGGGCDKTVTLNYDGDASGLHGSFVLKAGSASGSTIAEGGTTANCGSGTTSVVVVPTPDTHYHVASVSATNKTGNISGPDGDGNYTITYTQGSNISSTVTVTFEEDTKHTLTFYNNGTQVEQIQVYEGEKIGDDLPILTSGDACDATSNVFAGWTTENVGSTPVHTIDASKIVDSWTEPTANMSIYALWATIPASATTTFAAADYSAEAAPVTKSKDNITLYFDAGSIYKTKTPYTFSITSGDHYFSITASNKVLAKLETTCNDGTYCIYGVSDGTLSPNSSTASQTVTDINTYSVECYPKSDKQIRMQTCAVYCYDNYITTCADCETDPTVGDATLGTGFGASGVGVSVSSAVVGANCSWADYGFVWSTTNSTTSNLKLNNDGTAPASNTKVQVGTSGNASSFTGTITPVSAGTYYYRAYVKNGKDGAAYVYSSSVSNFVARSVTFNLKGHGSSTPTTQIVKDGAKATNPGDPSADGWRFDGWYDNESFTGSAWNFGSNTVTSNITLYAKWTQVYTVTYVYGTGGSGSCTNGSYAAGETVTTCSSATKTASTLTGWLRSDNSATITPGNTFTMPSTNVTLTAVWEDTPYTLTQTVGANTTKGYTASTIKSGDTPLDLTYSISAANKALPKTVTISGGRASWTLGTDYTWTLSSDKHSATLHINATVISSNVTVTVTEQTRYTITWNEHGSLSYSYFAADDNSLDWGDIDDCGEKKFYGWTADADFVSHATTPPTMISKGSTVSAKATYYAIYADAATPANPGYVQITDGNDVVSGTYMIASPSQSLAYAGQNSTNSYASVVKSISFDNVGKTRIASLPSGAVNLTLTKISTNKFTLKETTGATPTEKYLKGNSSNEIVYVATSTNPSLDNNYYWQLADFEKNDVTTSGQIHNCNNDRFFRYNSTGSGRIAAYQTSASTSEVYLYKLETTTYSNFAKTCTLYDISITTPSGGTVTTTPAAGEDAAGEGQTVTVNVTPNSCKYLSALKYNDGSDHEISIASTPYTFTMPAADVTVTATFSNKSVSSIAPNTNTHRTLMQGTSFEGEQIRVTYNNGETEDLAWDDATLTFSGYNMSTLGNQTVTVTYTGCGTTTTTYSITITDGIPVTFSDCGITTLRKYDPGDEVPVESYNGAYACSGWEFAGWSETSVAANSTSFTPVRNFTASTSKTLYAVYAYLRVNGSSVVEYESADMVADLKEGARYVLAYFTNSNTGISAGLTGMTPTATGTYYLAGTSSFAGTEDKNASNSYVYHSTASIAANAHWQLMADGIGYWQLYNKSADKYLDLSGHTSGYIAVSSSKVGKLVIGNYTESVGDNNSRLEVKYNGCSDPHYVSWDRSNSRFNQYSSGKIFMLTKDESFSSNPPCAPRSVTFHGSGGTVIARTGTPTGATLVITEASRDEGIYLPTAEMDALSCDGKEWNFIGWIDHVVDITRVPILSTDMVNDGYDPLNPNPHYDIVTDNDEFWAVYTNTGEPETKYGTISFIKDNFNQSYSSSENTVTKTVSTMGDYTFGYKRVGHAGNVGIQFEEDNGELYNKTSLGKINSISFTSFSSGDLSKLKVYVGDEEKTTDHQLTAAELQVIGSTYTYYPSVNGSYVYITNAGSGNHSYVCVGGISIDFGKGTEVYATTPDCSTLSLSGTVRVTSTNGKRVKAVTPITVSGHGLAANAPVTIAVYNASDDTPNSHFTLIGSASADVNGDVTSTNIVVAYQPTETSDGIEEVYFKASASNGSGTTESGKLTGYGRHLPAKFVIATKIGDDWYALPNAATSGTTYAARAKVPIVVDNATTPTTATVYSSTENHLAWGLNVAGTSTDRYTTDGEKISFVRSIDTKGLEANASGLRLSRAVVATNNAEYLLFDWTPSTTDLSNYTLQNGSVTSHYLATDGSENWTTATTGTNVRFLTYDAHEAPTITWQNDMLGSQHAQNTAENGVVTLPTGNDPVSCNTTLLPTFCGWKDGQITTYVTSAPTYVQAGDAATTDKTYYAVFKHATLDRWYTSCPNIYTITYKANGGTGADHVEYTMNSTADAITVETAGFTKEGSTFIGWTNPADDNGAIITPGTGKITGLTGDITLNAVWMGTTTITGTVRLTSAAGEKVATGATDVTISSTDFACATALRITYYDVTNNVTYGRSGSPSYTSSEFRLCNGSYGAADLSNISLAEVSGAYNQTFSMTYEPNGSANTLDHYQLKVEVLLKNTVIETKTLDLYGRTLPTSFAIAIKVGGSWYALPNNMDSEGTYDPILISVTEDASVLNWTAQGPSTVAYKMKHYSSNYSKLRFAANDANENCLWAATGDAAGIRNWSPTSTDNSYAWTVTETNADFNSYTMANLANTRSALKIYNSKWEMYNSGGLSEIHFIPFTPITPIDVTVMEWGVDEIAVKTVANWSPSAITAQISGGSATTVTKTAIGGDLYKLTGVGDLKGNPGEPLALNITDGGAKQAIIPIPFIIASNETKTEADLATILKNAGYAGTVADAREITKNMDVIVRSGGTLSSSSSKSGTFQNVYIYPGGKADFSKDISIQNIYMRGGFSWLGGAYAHPQLLVASGASISGIGSTNHGIFYDIYLDNAIYYMFALPKTVAVTAITNEENGSDWDAWIKLYSGEGRTLTPKESGWSYVTSGSIERGKGYEIAIKPRLNRPYGILRFPLLKSTAWSVEGDCSPEVKGWGMTNGNLKDGVSANNAGWNIIGNPFLTAYNNTEMPGSDPSGIIQTKTLVENKPDGVHWDGTYKWATSDVKYFTIPRMTEYEYDDVRAISAESPIKLEPFFPFFIQATGDGMVNFSAGNRVLKMPRRYAEETSREVMVDFALTNSNGVKDIAGLTISDQYSADFDMEDKEKTIQNGNASMKVYTMVGEYRTAFNSLPEATAAQPIPVGFIAPQAGKYNFSLVDGEYSEVEHVWLTDYSESAVVDLLLGEKYEFETEAGAFNERFALNVILKTKEDPIGTGVDAVGDDYDVPIKFIYQDKMYIRYRGVIYDATGKKVSEINK